MTNNDLQNIHIKLKIESWTRTPLKAKDEFRCSGRVGSLHRSCMYVLVDSWYTYSQLRSRKTQYKSTTHDTSINQNRSTTSTARKELPTLPEHLSSPRFFFMGPCFSILIFRVVLCRSLLVLFSLFLVPLCCLYLYDLRIVITPLVSSDSSCQFLFKMFLSLYFAYVFLHNI